MRKYPAYNGTGSLRVPLNRLCVCEAVCSKCVLCGGHCVCKVLVCIGLHAYTHLHTRTQHSLHIYTHYTYTFCTMFSTPITTHILYTHAHTYQHTTYTHTITRLHTPTYSHSNTYIYTHQHVYAHTRTHLHTYTPAFQ